MTIFKNKVTLIPTDKRLKQLVKDFGEEWNLILSKKVQCFNDVGFFIESPCGQHRRWVRRESINRISD